MAKIVCPICSGEGGSYEPCGEDYGMVWYICMECDGSGESEDNEDASTSWPLTNNTITRSIISIRSYLPEMPRISKEVQLPLDCDFS